MRHSSTSSSDLDLDPLYQSLETGNRVRVALMTLAAGILLWGGVVAIYNGLLALIGDINGRAVALIEHLPRIVSKNRNKEKVFVFGSSMVQADFEPLVFDAAMAAKGIDTISYNYGVGNLDPEFQELIARRIREAFEAGDERLALTLIEFNPFQATKVRNQFGTITRDQNVAVLSTVRELWKILLEDPTRGIRLFNIRHLRGGLSAELITSIPALVASEVPARLTEDFQTALEHSRELAARFRELAVASRPIEGSDYWRADIRGGRMDKSSLSVEALDALRDYMASRRYPGFMEVDLQRRIVGADILGLELEEALIEAFIRLVRDLAAVSERVEVILLPRNTAWVAYSPEVQGRLDKVMRRIERETGVAVRNFQVHPAIAPEHFVDTTHLSSYDGIDIFTRVLADEYAESLRTCCSDSPRQ